MEFKKFVATPGSNIDKFIGICLMSSGYIHSKHFVTKSYSAHKTYDKFYKSMPELVDKFVELYLGSDNSYNEQLITEYPTDSTELLNAIITLSETFYDELCHAGQSAIDEITTLCKQTKYLLTLK